jgi:hypothetical protein
VTERDRDAEGQRYAERQKEIDGQRDRGSGAESQR